MASRTQIICLCEGNKGDGNVKRTSIDPVFINTLMRSLKPDWLRPWKGSNVVRLEPRGGRKEVIAEMPNQLRLCLNAGANTTLMVWADCDDDCNNAKELRELFWQEAKRQTISKDQFERVVFIFAKDRIENWIQFVATGKTDESKEGPRVTSREAAEAAKKLASICRERKPVENLPPSLHWSCGSWRALDERMKTA